MNYPLLLEDGGAFTKQDWKLSKFKDGQNRAEHEN